MMMMMMKNKVSKPKGQHSGWTRSRKLMVRMRASKSPADGGPKFTLILNLVLILYLVGWWGPPKIHVFFQPAAPHLANNNKQQQAATQLKGAWNETVRYYYISIIFILYYFLRSVPLVRILWFVVVVIYVLKKKKNASRLHREKSFSRKKENTTSAYRVPRNSS